MTTDLPAVIADHIAGINASDLGAAIATFAADAYANGNRNEARGIAAVRAWITKEYMADHVTMEVLDVANHYGDVIVKAQYDGTYDKTNLPDPLILNTYFAVRDGKIVSLLVSLD
jgi:hypothetical protein